MPSDSDPGARPPAQVRAQQECEVTTSYALTTLEHSLADEARAVGRALRSAGIELDPQTFVALRIVDACLDEDVDPAAALDALAVCGTLARSVQLVRERLERDAA